MGNFTITALDHIVLNVGDIDRHCSFTLSFAFGGRTGGVI
jgi:hypothetical protein